MAGDNIRDVLLLFDVDGTLTLPRLDIEEKMFYYLKQLRDRVTVGLVGGSDLNKIAGQTILPELKTKGCDVIQMCVDNFDYVFAENGLVSYKNGQLLAQQSLLHHLGEANIQRFINYCLQYMSTLTLPAKRGNFVEFRNGLINICPVGRSCSQEERIQFNNYDQQHNIRRKFIEALEKQFGSESQNPLALKYSIGGQISFDVFPEGWDKTYCLNLIDESHKVIHFFGDKTSPGGNDFEIFDDPRTIGHTVTSPADTIRQLEKLGF